MNSITRRQRKALFFLSACGYLAWFTGIGEPLHAEGMTPSVATTFTLRKQRDLPAVAAAIVRDPFESVRPVAASDGDNPVRASSQSAAIQRTAASDVTVPDIVPNAPVAGPTVVLTVRATMVGPNPVAYIANGTSLDIVRVGDDLGDRRVTGIDLRGIALSDGSRLDLPDRFLAAPRPTKRHSITLGIDDLHRLLVPAGRTHERLDASPTSTYAPVSGAAKASAEATAGPLPTVDARGLPIGVNPTPNPSAPTPFPYPYPYAPPPRG